MLLPGHGIPPWMLQAMQARAAQQAQLGSLRGGIDTMSPMGRVPMHGARLGGQALGGHLRGTAPVQAFRTGARSALGFDRLGQGLSRVGGAPRANVPGFSALQSAAGPAMGAAGIGLGLYDSLQKGRDVGVLADEIRRAPVSMQRGLRSDLVGNALDRGYEDALMKGGSGALSGAAFGPVGAAVGGAIGASGGLGSQIRALAKAGLLDQAVRESVQRTGRAATFQRGAGVSGHTNAHLGRRFLPHVLDFVSPFSGGLGSVAKGIGQLAGVF